MSQTLQLEYICTKKEVDEAQTLVLHKQLGGGSKIRARIVLLFLVILASVTLYFQTLSFPASFRWYILGGAFAISIAFVFWKRKVRSRRPKPLNQVQISEAGLTILIGGAMSISPWSAFSDCLESPGLFVLVNRSRTTITMLPKRAFPGESWQIWFRNLANNRPPPDEQTQPTLAASAVPANSLTLRFRIGFRDYADRAAASTFTWGAIVAAAGLILGCSIYAGMNPPPHPVYSGKQVYFMFMLPTTLVMAVMIFLIFTIRPWLAHRKHLIPQEMSLSEESLGFKSADGTGLLPWTTYKYYKETCRSFILWNPKGLIWVLIPKRAFTSADDLERCRALLVRHLRKGRWFS